MDTGDGAPTTAATAGDVSVKVKAGSDAAAAAGDGEDEMRAVAPPSAGPGPAKAGSIRNFLEARVTPLDGAPVQRTEDVWGGLYAAMPAGARPGRGRRNLIPSVPAHYR
jgi:hypothetical protein